MAERKNKREVVLKSGGQVTVYVSLDNALTTSDADMKLIRDLKELLDDYVAPKTKL